jgi:cob(I)alamin adenosyltransferase
MSPFYTAQGDSGDTGYLGPGRISKASLRIEAVGSVDEASAALGLARSLTKNNKTQTILRQVQKQLYVLMSELSADPSVAHQFNQLSKTEIDWLEGEIAGLEDLVDIPRAFILPGENPTSAALDLARTVIRRAERRAIALLDAEEVKKPLLIAYLNRLSSLIFVLEIYEITIDGSNVALAKEQ